MKDNVLIMTSGFPLFVGDVQGGGNFVYELCSRLKDEFDIIVSTPFVKGAASQEIMNGISVERYRYMLFDDWMTLTGGEGIPSKLRKNKLNFLVLPFFFFAQLRALAHLVARGRIKTIHAHWLIPQGFIAVLYKKMFNRKIRVIVTIHGSDIWGMQGTLGNVLKRFILKNVDTLTVVSNAIKEEVRKLGYQREVYVYPMGIDTDKFSPSRRDDTLKAALGIRGPFLLFVGWLSREKGTEYLLEAMPRVLARHPDAKLVVIGDGARKPDLRELAVKLDIQDNVIFLGALPHDELPRYFASADIYVGPSISEGFGLVFAEAASSGTAVIATDLPAIRDIIHDGDTGFIIGQKDPRQISDKIHEVLTDCPEIGAIKARARVYVKDRYDWTAVADNYLRIYRAGFSPAQT